MNTLETERRDVTGTLAALGFESSRLPSAVELDGVTPNRIDALSTEMKSEADPAKRCSLAAQIIALRDKTGPSL